MKNYRKYSLAILIFTMSMISCGGSEDSKGNSNVYNRISIRNRSIQGSEEDYTANKAVALMNAKKVDEAIQCLEEFLADNPHSKITKSILSTAYMQKSGVDLLNIVTKIIDIGTGASNVGSGNYNDLVSVVSDIIGKYDENIMEYMKKADTLLKNLEDTSTLDDYDRLKKMITNVSLISLRIISFADNFKSGFKKSDLDTKITEEVATEIMEQLISSREAIEDMVSTSSLSEEEIEKVKTEIDNFYNSMTEASEGDGTLSVDDIKQYIREHYHVDENL